VTEGKEKPRIMSMSVSEKKREKLLKHRNKKNRQMEAQE